MASSNKRNTILASSILTGIFAAFSIFLLIQFFSKPLSEESKNSFWFGRREIEPEYTKIISEAINLEISSKDAKDISEKALASGYQLYITEDKIESYYKPPFEFIITNQGIEVSNPNRSDFYDYDLLQVGSIITKIDGEDLTELSYFKILEKLYSKKECVKELTLKTGDKINLEYKMINYSAKFNEIDKDNIEVELYDLDNTSAAYFYEQVKGYSNISLDLSKAKISSLESIRSYISLFTLGKEKLFSSPSDIKAIGNMKINACINIKVNNNSNTGIRFMLSTIEKIGNVKVSVLDTYQQLNSYNYFVLIEGKEYNVYISKGLIIN